MTFGQALIFALVFWGIGKTADGVCGNNMKTVAIGLLFVLLGFLFTYVRL